MIEEPPRVFVSTIEERPDRIHISIAQGSGKDTTILRKELSLYEMRQLHVKLTAALYFRWAKDGSP